jgi:hypothetical protein
MCIAELYYKVGDHTPSYKSLIISSNHRWCVLGVHWNCGFRGVRRASRRMCGRGSGAGAGRMCSESRAVGSILRRNALSLLVDIEKLLGGGGVEGPDILRVRRRYSLGVVL